MKVSAAMPESEPGASSDSALGDQGKPRVTPQEVAVVHDDRRMVESRLERAVSQFVHPARYPLTVPLQVSAWHAPGEPVPVQEALKAEYRPFGAGGEWGGPWSTTWFRFQGEVPPDWAGRRVEALLDLG